MKISLLLQLFLLAMSVPGEARSQHQRKAIGSCELCLITRNGRLNYIDRKQRIAALQRPTTAESGEAYYVTITGADRVIVTDAQGNTNAYIEGTPFDERVPGVMIAENQTSADVIFGADSPPQQFYTLTFRSLGKPIEIELTKGLGTPETATQIIRYLDLNLPTGTTLMLKITGQGVENVRYDADGNGSFESIIHPTASAIGKLARDAEAPVVKFSERIRRTSRVITITATDNFSGVKMIPYSLDGKKYQPYSAPIVLNAFQSATIYAFADDKVANRSGVFTHEVKPSRHLVPRKFGSD